MDCHNLILKRPQQYKCRRSRGRNVASFRVAHTLLLRAGRHCRRGKAHSPLVGALVAWENTERYGDLVAVPFLEVEGLTRRKATNSHLGARLFLRRLFLEVAGVGFARNLDGDGAGKLLFRGEVGVVA